MDVASGTHSDITFISDCRWLKAHPLFLYPLEKYLAIPTPPFFVNGFCVILYTVKQIIIFPMDE